MSKVEARLQALREASDICSRICEKFGAKKNWEAYHAAWDCQMAIDGLSGDFERAFGLIAPPKDDWTYTQTQKSPNFCARTLYRVVHCSMKGPERGLFS